MGVSVVPLRLHRHLAAMVALEQAIADQLDELSAAAEQGTAASAELAGVVDRLRELTERQRQALAARLEAVAPGMPVPEFGPPASPLHQLEAGDHRTSAALVALHAACSQAVIGYAVLMELALRAGDSVEVLGPDNTGDLARQHMRAYVAATRDVVRTLTHVVALELEEEGQECRCVCPSCAIGVCLCWLAPRRQLAMAWADADPIDALAGIELVRPRSGSPADRAGLRKGDVLLSVDGADIESLPNLQEAIRSHAAGDEIAFGVQRATGKREEVRVTRG